VHRDTRTIQVRPDSDDLVEKLRADCPSVAWSRGKDTDPSALCRPTLKVLRDAVRRVPVAAEA